MAQQSLKNSTEWKPGTKCDLFDRNSRKWVEVEVVGSFSDDKGEWIKVRWGQKVHNVLGDDPDLRRRAKIPGRELKQLQDAAVQLPNIAPILERFLPSSPGQGLYANPDGLLYIFCTYNATYSHCAEHVLQNAILRI